MALELPDFPWDSLAPFAATAREHVDGLIDLSIGSPVDETPALIRAALADATDAHAYPQTAGTPQLREAIVAWYARRRGVDDLSVANVMPTIGSKELVTLLPLLLGLGKGDLVVHPSVAYPSYAIGAAIVGATAVACDDPALWPAETKLVWVNSPGNPDGRVLSVDELRAGVARARELDAIIASDECYAELAWQGESPSILDPRVIHGERNHVLSVYSLSKQSNLAGYRAGFVAGCSDIVGGLLEARKHIGLIPPAPVQAAMVVALGDDEHVATQRARYAARRAALAPALTRAGFALDRSEAGLYLWVTRGEDAWATVSWFAERGILVAPGSFYGDETHVRVAITATDEAIASAVSRLAVSS